MMKNIIPASQPVVYALFYRGGDDERDAFPVVGWLHEEHEIGGHFLHGFYLNHAGDITLCEENDNFNRYSYTRR